MMKTSLLILILVLNLIFPVTSRVQTSQSQAAIQGVVVQSGGDALIQREGWTEFTHLSIGAPLHDGDLINPKNTPVRVICGDFKVQIITRLSPVPCPKMRAIFYANDSALAGWQRGTADDPRIPTLLAPRNSAVLSATPLILWRAVTDADSYRISVRGVGLEWSHVVKGGKSASLQYPNDAPKLESDKAYTVEIVALAQGMPIASSNDEGAPDTGFSVLDAQRTADLAAYPQKLHSALSDKTLEDFVLAQLYADNNLYADAIGLIVPLITAAKSKKTAFAASPIPSLVLGNVYRDIGARSAARDAFQSAQDLADAASDMESAAIALDNLAQLSITNSERAALLEKAIAAWNALGAISQADAIRQQTQ